MKQIEDTEIGNVVNMIISDYDDDRTVNKIDIYNQPDKKAIVDIVEKLLKILYPSYYNDKVYKIYSLKNNMSATIEDVIFHLKKQIMIALKYCREDDADNEQELEEKAKKITLCKCQYKNVGFISYKRVGKPTCLYDIF